MILPKEEGELFVEEAQNQNLHLNRLTRVFGSPDAPEKRWLLEFSFIQKSYLEAALIVRDGNANRSEAYKMLTKDFYL